MQIIVFLQIQICFIYLLSKLDHYCWGGKGYRSSDGFNKVSLQGRYNEFKRR
jgi:hypothetical protein